MLPERRSHENIAIVSVLALLFLGETLTWVQGLGAVVILSSGALIYSSDIANG